VLFLAVAELAWPWSSGRQTVELGSSIADAALRIFGS
jgi:hypothetical protein